MKKLVFVFLFFTQIAFAQNRQISKDTVGVWKVKMLQKALIEHGYKLKITGKYDSKTKNAMSKHNNAVGLPAFHGNYSLFCKSLGLPLDFLND